MVPAKCFRFGWTLFMSNVLMRNGLFRSFGLKWWRAKMGNCIRLEVVSCYLLSLISSGSNHLCQAFQLFHEVKVLSPLNLHNRKKLKALLLLAMRQRRMNADSFVKYISGQNIEQIVDLRLGEPLDVLKAAEVVINTKRVGQRFERD